MNKPDPQQYPKIDAHQAEQAGRMLVEYLFPVNPTDRFRCWLGSAWIDGVLLREMAGKLRDALRMT